MVITAQKPTHGVASKRGNKIPSHKNCNYRVLKSSRRRTLTWERITSADCKSLAWSLTLSISPWSGAYFCWKFWNRNELVDKAMSIEIVNESNKKLNNDKNLSEDSKLLSTKVIMKMYYQRPQVWNVDPTGHLAG